MHVKPAVPSPRACHACTACCVQLPIPAGHVGTDCKPAGVECPSMHDCGCGIYASRPTICRDFRCAWLADPSWPDAWRPDLSGLLCLREPIANEHPAAAVYELRPDALVVAPAVEILAELQRTTTAVVLIDCGKNRRRLPGYWIERRAEPVRRMQERAA